MQNLLVTRCVLFALFFYESYALNVDNYVAFIEERSRDDNFVEEYSKWSTNILSQSGYLYGTSHMKFPCISNKHTKDHTVPTSVHALRPSDIKCVGAMGDSFLTGLGARGVTPIDLLFEDRGISWAVGGDYTYSQIPTIPNALRQYKTNLNGYSTKGSLLSPREKYVPNNRLNVARAGARSSDMPAQADLLIEILKTKPFDHCRSSWKMITIFVGANDLCHFCEDPDNKNDAPEQYVTNIRLALDRLYNASIPRMLINLVLPADIHGFQEYNSDMFVCQTLVKKICPCVVGSTTDQAETLDSYILQYQELLRNLTSSERYDLRDDFTIVIQPFMSKTQLPFKSNQTIDFSYLSPDCFHFSGKGHSQAAISLWNNLFEPVGDKRETWNIDGPVKCPTEDYPYIFTSKNSVKTANKLQTNNADQDTDNVIVDNATAIVSTMNNRTSTVVYNVVAKVNSTGDYIYSTRRDLTTSLLNRTNTTNNAAMDALDASVAEDNNSQSKPSPKKRKFFILTGFTLLIVLALVMIIVRRQKRSRGIATDGDGNFNRLEESEDDMDIYTKPPQHTYSDDNKITTTHGSRVPLD